ncbi:hypothetical protein, partial [uncultured Selenomonas sp.]|uniref:hypothetical protein n=1 Tax=uncultured Selenomonas sp. TaxID=159275 RepID=UPI0028DBF761
RLIFQGLQRIIYLRSLRNMSKVRPEALHKMTFTRDASHQIHVIPQHPDTSISICQSLGTQHILHIIYICAQEPS